MGRSLVFGQGGGRGLAPSARLAQRTRLQVPVLARWLLLCTIVALFAGCDAPFARWHAQQVLDAFEGAGLAVDEPMVLSGDDYGSAPPVATEGISFVIPTPCPCNSGAVRLYTFESRRDLEAMRQHYERFDEDNRLATARILVKDNVLMRIDGTPPEDMVKAYQRVLDHLG